MSIPKQTSRVAVIGAGPSGLAAVKYGTECTPTGVPEYLLTIC